MSSTSVAQMAPPTSQYLTVDQIREFDNRYQDLARIGTRNGTSLNLTPALLTIDNENIVKQAAEISRLPVFESSTKSPSKFTWALKEWDGRVVSINKTHMSALLSPVSGPDINTETLEYPLGLLSSKQKADIRVGSALRLSYGCSKLENGTLKYEIAVVLRPSSIFSRRNARRAAAKLKVMLDNAVVASPDAG